MIYNASLALIFLDLAALCKLAAYANWLLMQIGRLCNLAAFAIWLFLQFGCFCNLAAFAILAAFVIFDLLIFLFLLT
jgi:hypothetical protein